MGAQLKLYRQSSEDLAAWLAEVIAFIRPFEEFCNELPRRLSVLPILDESIDSASLLQQLLLELADMASRRPATSQIEKALDTISKRHAIPSVRAWKGVRGEILQIDATALSNERVELLATHLAETIKTWLSPHYELRDAIKHELKIRHTPRRKASPKTLARQRRDTRLKELFDELFKEDKHLAPAKLRDCANQDKEMQSIQPEPKITYDICKAAIKNYRGGKSESSKNPTRKMSE